MVSALPFIQEQLSQPLDESLKPKLLKAFYYLNRETDINQQIATIGSLNYCDQRAALEGLLNKKDEQTDQLVIERLMEFSKGTREEKMLALDVVMESPGNNYASLLSALLQDNENEVYKKAMEAAGKTKTTELLNAVIEKAAATHSYASLKRAIVNYGDVFYSKEIQPDTRISSKLLLLLIRAAGNTKGENSTKFLINNIAKSNQYFNEIIEALWLKKAELTPEAAGIIDNCLNDKIDQSKCKADYYLEVALNKKLVLLEQGIMMEIHKDLEVLLKAFAMLYNREKIGRVVELLKVGNTAKMSNAVEILELTIPKKRFALINMLVELIDDTKNNHLADVKTTEHRVIAIIEEILKSNKANFSEWTRSVACFILPKLKRNELFVELLSRNTSKEEYLFNETRAYVLTMIK
jgi:hypothetical protein